MAINYPTSLDTLSNPSAIDTLNNVTTPHATQHGNLNDIVEALEAKVGINGSAVTTSHDYKLSAVTSTAKALTSGTSTQSVTNLTLVTPTLTIGSDATGDMYYRNSGGTISKLALGTTGQVVAAGAGGVPEYTTIAANQDASTTVKGVVEEATLAETLARTAAGGTSARLFVNPTNLTTVQTYDYAASAAGSDTYAITASPAPTAYVTGQIFTFKADVANTGACTLNVNSLGAKTLKNKVSADLSTGDILANQIVTVVYDGTNFQVLSKVAQAIAFRSGTATRAGNTASGAQTIAHGLGVAPSYVKLYATWARAGSNAANIAAISMGVYDSTGQRSTYQKQMTAETGVGSFAAGYGLSTTQGIAIYSVLAAGTEGSQVAVVSVDATNITLTWTYSAGGNLNANDINIVWEAYA